MKENQKRTQRRLQLQKDMVWKALGLPEGQPGSHPMWVAGLPLGTRTFRLWGAPAPKKVLVLFTSSVLSSPGSYRGKLFSLPLDPAGNSLVQESQIAFVFWNFFFFFFLEVRESLWQVGFCPLYCLILSTSVLIHFCT